MSRSNTVEDVLGLIERRSDSECWGWSGRVDRDGYARISFECRNALAHRVVYELLVGHIPEGMELDHLCRNRACTNPKHLEAVTPEENKRRASRNPPTHCPYGHLYDSDNTYRSAKQMYCRACWRRRSKERYQRRKAATALS